MRRKFGLRLAAPSRAKALVFIALCGTAEAVPYPKPSASQNQVPIQNLVPIQKPILPTIGSFPSPGSAQNWFMRSILSYSMSKASH
jgi:hypothetical protein